jgi:hypothetical protein
MTFGVTPADVPPVTAAGENFDSPLRGQLADATDDVFGAGMVAYNDSLTYPEGSVGAQLSDIVDSGLSRLGLSPLDFEAVGDGVTVDTMAWELLLANLAKSALVTTTQAINSTSPQIIDLAGRTYRVGKLLAQNLYNVWFVNGRLIADPDYAWQAGDAILNLIQDSGIVHPPATPWRQQRIRNVGFERIKIDGGRVANGMLLAGTYEVTIQDCQVVHYAAGPGGYGIATVAAPVSGVAGLVDGSTTKNTQLRIVGTTCSYEELSELVAGEDNTQSGTAFRLRNADFVFDGCVAFACEVGLDVDGFFNAQVSNYHGFTQSANYVMKVGPDCHSLLCTNLYADTGIVELRSFSHSFTGGGFLSNADLHIVTTTANNDLSGLCLTNMQFSHQPVYLTEGAGSFASAFKASFIDCRRFDGAPILGANSVIVSRGTATSPAIRGCDLTAQDADTGIFFPLGEVHIGVGGADQLAVSSHIVKVGNGVGNQRLEIDGSGSGGFVRFVHLQSGSVDRWTFGANDTADAANAGSDFELRRHNDAGVIRDSPLVVERANGHTHAAHLYPGAADGASQSTCALRAGNGVPSNANGANGDFFFRGDGTAGSLIYHKVGGAWVAVV